MAIITLPSDVKSFIQQTMDDILSSGVYGKLCTLYYPPIESGCNNCFTGDSVIISEFGPKKIKDVKLNEYVYNNNGLRKVNGVFNALYNGDLYNIKAWGISDNCWCTRDHKIPILENNLIIEKQAKDLLIGDRILLGKQYFFKHNDLKFIDTEFGKLEIDEDLLYFFGIFIAEGHLKSGNREISISLCKSKEMEIALKICNIIEKKLNIKGKIVEDKGDGMHIEFYSSKLYRLVSQFGYRNHNKCISDYLFNNLSKKQLKYLIHAYWIGDGFFRRNTHSITTTSYKLAHQIFIFLQNMEFYPNIFYQPYRKINNINHREHWVVEWIENRKLSKPHIEYFEKYITTTIRKIIIKKGLEIVYNLSVDGEHEFICNNMLVKNCLPDPIGNKSSNIYVHGGPMEFSTGQICPMCRGAYYLAIEQSEDIYMTINWEPSQFDKSFPAGHRYADGNIMTRGYSSDLQKVCNCSFMEIFANAGIARYRFKLIGEPTLSTQAVDSRYFWAWWDRA